MRTFYGNIAGLILIATIYSGHQFILTSSPDFTSSSYLSVLFLIPVAVDLYRTEGQSMQLKKLPFYSTIGLGIFLYVISVIQQAS